ncbi:MAG: hypothetical protein LLG42_13645 [Chloroflexi bacterium]|nr:hypothetical protein [Chloroflexota bacterium]
MFEIYYLPMHVELGVEQPETPTMLVSLPPRRTQRSRSQDVVSIFLTILEGTPPPARFLENMLEDTVSRYYSSSSSTTNGLRTAAEYLNSQLLEYNAELQENHKGDPAVGTLNMAVLKGELLSIMHVGPASTWLLLPGQLQTYDNEDEQGKGLGITRTISARFFQTSVSPDSLLLFCAKPSDKWTELDLTHGPRLTINLLRRRLLATDVEQFQAGIIQLKPSDQWAVRHLRLRSLPLTEPTEAGSSTSRTIESVTQVPFQTPLEDHQPPTETPAPSAARPQPALFRKGTLTSAADARTGEPPVVEEPKNQMAETDDSVVLPHNNSPEKAVGTRQRVVAEKPLPPKTERKPRQKTPVDPAKELEHSARKQANRKKLAITWQFWHQRQQKTSLAIKTFLHRLLPGVSDESPSLTGGIMLMISILIPLLVVFFAISVYFEQGRGQQHTLYLDQARVFAAEARKADDPATIRNNWQQAIYWLDLAEEYQKSDDSKRLRLEANNTLDAMDGVERLDFEDLYSFGFSDSLNFVQIAANDTEVYLLDSVQGNVVRLFLTGQGYQLDENFSCGPGSSGTQLIGKFVDLINLPAGNPNKAAILAVDDVGNIAYCIPGAVAPLTSTLAAPPDGWGKIQAISLYQGTLYVLDSKAGAVYYYTGFTSGYGDTVQTFFDPQRDTTLPELDDMVDLAAYEEDLYLLHKNGTIAHCISGIWETKQTRCDDPASFGDIRPIQTDDALLFSETLFSQIQASAQPEPSLYLLDINAPEIYRFSLQLNLDRLLRPAISADAETPRSPATAFTISSSREAFLAYGNKVFYASLAK